jgi:hypothetical protein
MVIPKISMASLRPILFLLRRRAVWIAGTLALSTAMFALVSHHDNKLSGNFRTAAQQAYRAVIACDSYKEESPASYEAREVDAEKAVAAAGAIARTHADRIAAMALSDYLHQVKTVRLAWENRDRRSVRRDYVQYTHELRAAKQTARTYLD